MDFLPKHHEGGIENCPANAGKPARNIASEGLKIYGQYGVDVACSNSTWLTARRDDADRIHADAKVRSHGLRPNLKVLKDGVREHAAGLHKGRSIDIMRRRRRGEWMCNARPRGFSRGARVSTRNKEIFNEAPPGRMLWPRR